MVGAVFGGWLSPLTVAFCCKGHDYMLRCGSGFGKLLVGFEVAPYEWERGKWENSGMAVNRSYGQDHTIFTVSVDVGQTACKVPLATEYIKKIEMAGRVGNKRKTFKC